MAVQERTDPDDTWKQRLGVWWIAEDHPDLLAVVASPQGPRTYAELAGGAHQLVHLFRSLGVTVGDPIAVLVPNGLTIVEVSLACQEAGFLFLPLNTHLTTTELAAIMEHSGTKVLVVDASLTDKLADLDPDALGLCVLRVGAPKAADALPELGTDRLAHPTTKPDSRVAGGLFVYTSGTTGKPKGIKRKVEVGDPDELANGGALFGRAFDFTPFQGPMLVSTGMFHGGSHSFFMGGLHVGHALIIMEKFDAEESLRLIAEHKVRSAYMVPTQFSRFLRLPEEKKAQHDVSSLHAVVHSAAPCPRDVKQQMMDWWGPVIWETYGGMEGAATIAKPHRWLEKPGTVGRTVKGVEVAILDDAGNELPRGQVGHIYMQTGVGFEYHNDAEGTSSAHRGKRFTIGDIGHLDADGYLFISDRAKDMIITGGTNVYPAEVEAALTMHAAVADVAVIGVPDADWGESVKAIVELAPGHSPSNALAADLIAYSKTKLASYKCPRSVDFRDELPRTEAGKLYKRKLRDEYAAPPPSIDKLAWLRVERGRVLCARSKGKALFYAPGGKRETGESDEVALTREIVEELSVALVPSTIAFVHVFSAQADAKPAGVLVTMTCYRADYEGELRPASEIDEIAWLSYDDKAKTSVVTQQIFDWLHDSGEI